MWSYSVIILSWWEIIFKTLRLHEGLIYITSGNIVGAALTGVFWLVLAAVQNVIDYGQINYIIAIGSLAGSIALLGLNTTVTTLLPRGNGSISIQANQIILISGTICAVLASLFNWMLFFFVLGMAFWMMTSYELLGKKAYRKYALNIIGARGSQLLLSLVLFHYIGLPGIIIGFVISFFLFSRGFYSSIPMFGRRFHEIRTHFKTSLHLQSLQCIFIIFWQASYCSCFWLCHFGILSARFSISNVLQHDTSKFLSIPYSGGGHRKKKE